MGNWVPVDRVALVAFASLLALSIYGYLAVPSSGAFVFIIPAVAALVSAVSAATIKTPMRLNLPFDVPEECSAQVAPASVAFQRLVRAEVIVGLAAIELGVIVSSKVTEIPDAPFVLLPFALLATVLGTVVVFAVRVWRIVRG